MVTWKIVGAPKVLVLYIYIDYILSNEMQVLKKHSKEVQKFIINLE